MFVTRENLTDFVRNSVESVAGPGSAEQAAVFADATVWADAVGRATHGVWRLPAYLKRIESGLIKCPCELEVVSSSTSATTIDGGNGLGQYVASEAIRKSVELAERSGISCVGVRNSNHFGAGGYFVAEAARSGCLSILTSSSFAKVAAHGGTKAVFGTNPLAIGVPREGKQPLIIDMATSAVSGGSIIQAAEAGYPIPDGAMVDELGHPVTDPAEASQGTLLPFGGAKGSAIALFVELLATCLTGAAPSTEVKSMFSDFSGGAQTGHFVIAIDPSIVGGDRVAFENAVTALLAMIQSSSGGEDNVRLPGDHRWEQLSEAERRGCELTPEALQAIQNVSSRYGIDQPRQFEEKGSYVV